MNESLGQLLKNLDCNNDKDTYNYTHVSMISPKCKVSLGDTQRQQFMKEYIQRIKYETAGIAEIPNKIVPVIFDIDLKKPGQVVEKLYTFDDVLETIQIIQRKLKELIQDEKLNVTCAYLSKDPYIQDGMIKNGFHLHFPYIFMEISQYSLYVNKSVKDDIEKIFLQNVINHGKIVDDCSKNCWLMYGSCKDMFSKPYLLECWVDDTHQIISRNIDYSVLHNLFSIHIGERAEYFYPIQENHIELIEQLDELPKEYKNTTYTLSELDFYLSIIDMSRFDDYENWMQIGWALYSIGNGCRDVFDLWDKYSAQSPKYVRSELKYHWDKMYIGKYTIGTLKYLAKKDNKDAYLEYQRSLLKNDIQGIHGTDNQIAKIVFKRFGEEIKCASMKEGTWYQFRNHIWERIEEAVCIMEYLDMMSSIYLDQERVYSQLFIDTGEKEYQELKKHCFKMGCKLGGNRSKSSILRECRQVFYDEYFEEKLNTNKYLIAFKNGVYDLKEYKFRNGNPEDYLSKRLPINYNNFSDENEWVMECRDFLSKVFPDKTLREYFIDTTTDLFIGGNFNKCFYFWTGDGNNGKSVTQKIICRMFGYQYSKTLPSTMLTNKKQKSSGCNPDMVQLRDAVRVAFFQEPDNIGSMQILLNSGIVKDLSGNDDQYARDIHEKGRDIKPMEPFFKPIMICNDLLGMTNDSAVWNRVRVLQFEANFVEEGYPESAKEQHLLKKFPMNKTFDEKIPHLLEPFAWILLTHLKYRKGCMKAPIKVVSASNQYRKQNDVYQQFFEEKIEDTGDLNHILSLDIIYNVFLDWYDMNHITIIRKPSKLELKKFLKGKLKRQQYRGESWKGFRIYEIKVVNHEFIDDEGEDEEKEE